MHILRRSLASLAAVTALLISGCATAVDGIAITTGTTAPAGDRLAEALAFVPATAGSAEVMDLATTKQRWGLTAVTSEIDENAPEAVEFRKKLVETGLGSTLMTYNALFKGAGWNGYDVETEIRPTVGGPPVTIYRLRSSLDMQTVIDSFTADGMTRTGPDDSPFFASASIGDGQFGKVFLSGVTVYPARHQLVAGPQGSWTMPAAGASLASVPGVPDLVADLPSAGYVAIDTGAFACVDPVRPLGGSGTPDTVKEYLAGLDAAGTRQAVTGTLVAVTADDEGQVRAGYADEATAAADLPVRTKILQTVNSAVTNRPYRLLYTAQISAVGPTLRYAMSMKRPAILIQSRAQADEPWAFC